MTGVRQDAPLADDGGLSGVIGGAADQAGPELSHGELALDEGGVLIRDVVAHHACGHIRHQIGDHIEGSHSGIAVGQGGSPILGHEVTALGPVASGPVGIELVLDAGDGGAEHVAIGELLSQVGVLFPGPVYWIDGDALLFEDIGAVDDAIGITGIGDAEAHVIPCAGHAGDAGDKIFGFDHICVSGKEIFDRGEIGSELTVPL